MMNTRLISVLISGLFLVACQKEAPNSPASTENKTSSTAVETGMISPQVDVAPRPAFNANWKTYTFATEPNYPPLEYRNKNTEIIGFETDILYAVAESAQFNVKLEAIPLASFDATLSNKKADAWISGLILSDELQKKVAVSQPFLENSVVVGVLDKPENANIKTINDLKDKGISVSAYYPPDMKELAKQLSNNKMTERRSIYLSVQNVFKGETVGVLAEDRALQYFEKIHDEKNGLKFRFIPTNAPKHQLVFGVAQDNPELLAQIDKGLSAIKANGSYDKIVNKWFGTK